MKTARIKTVGGGYCSLKSDGGVKRVSSVIVRTGREWKANFFGLSCEGMWGETI